MARLTIDPQYVKKAVDTFIERSFKGMLDDQPIKIQVARAAYLAGMLQTKTALYQDALNDPDDQVCEVNLVSLRSQIDAEIRKLIVAGVAVDPQTLS